MTSYVYDLKSYIEKDRLLERDRRTSIRRSRALEGVETSSGSSILDVGSGTGVLGFDLLKRFPNSSLYCVDLEPSILARGREAKPPSGSASFIGADVYLLPFEEATFNVVACQYLLQHLEDPASALIEMRRVSRTGALASVFEWDDGANFIHPPVPDELNRLLKAKIDLIKRRGGNRNIGRKLYHLLSESGWQDIEVRLVHDIWQGPEDRSAALKGTELSLLELRSQLMKEEAVTEDESNRALDQLYSFYCGDIFSVVFFFAAYARNPGI
jgi:ubiquinone/menaquinone biosynthesis C-methylase UbiE